MVKQCCSLTTLGSQCKQLSNLNRMLFIDPDRPIEEKWICYQHAKEYIDQEKTDITNILIYLMELNDEKQKHTTSSKNLEIVGIDEAKRKRKKKFDELLKRLRTQTCRYSGCRKPIENNQIKCCVEIRSHYNTPRENLFYHRECFRHIRARFGFKLPIHSGQFQLENTCEMNSV